MDTLWILGPGMKKQTKKKRLSQYFCQIYGNENIENFISIQH